MTNNADNKESVEDTTSNKPPIENDFIFHLRELRQHVTRCLICFIVVLLPLAFFQWDIFEIVAGPVFQVLGGDTPLISTRTVDPVFVPLKLAMLVALLISAPYFIFQAWSFIVPGLFQSEKLIGKQVVVSSVIFFYLGCAFAFFVTLPLMFKFFSSVVPNGVIYQPDINSYFNFLFISLLSFGAAFEVPVICFILIRMGLMSITTLANGRPVYVMTTAIIAAVITPPDALSMLLFLLPMWLLFEGSLIFLRLTTKKEEER